MEDNKGRFVPVVKPHFVSHGLGLSGPIRYNVGRDLKQIGAAVRDARERLGLTRDALAMRVGVDAETIKKIESGERVKQWTRVADMAEALNTSPNELLGFPVASPEALGTALRPILAAFGHNPEDAESIARILLEAVEAAQSAPGDEPEGVRYRIAGQLAASRSRGQKAS